MGYLKFYTREAEEHRDTYDIEITTHNEIRKIVNKLTRHYKMRPIRVIFEARTVGHCYPRSRLLDFPKSGASIGLICHEVGHQYHYDQIGKRGHTKKLMTRIRRLNNYCRKMEFWGLAHS